jgi:tetratricopeptide (TPR) repeat protein
MNKMVLFFGVVFTSMMAFTQVKTADLSPRATVKQQAGLTNFELDYARPSARERKVFGEIVPYDKMWRTGANLNSTIAFDTEIYIGNDTINAGRYSIFTVPGEKEWKVYFYSKTDIRGVPKDWDESLVVLSTNAPVQQLNDVEETFTIAFTHINANDCKLVFSWEKTRVEIPIQLPTVALTMASIKNVMNGPSDRDYYSAASFYLEQGEELEMALEYINKAVEIRGEEAFWYTRKQAQILYANGKTKEAIAAAERSKAAAEKVNYSSYVKMNEEDIAKWKKEIK